MRDDNKGHHRDVWEPAIFWQFIEKDRNMLLHDAFLSVVLEVTRTSSVKAYPDLSELPETTLVRNRYNIETGSFAGRDQRDVILESIDWWERQITSIEEGTV